MIRNSVRQVFKRHVSSQSTRSSQPVSLSPEKMRALVALYHRTENFVTPENLDARIDQAFIPTSDHLAFHDSANHTFASYVELENREMTREKIPRISEYTPSSHYYGMPEDQNSWSDFQDPRERAVVEALYGTVDQTKPGWDILEESAERIQGEIKEDRKNEYALEILFWSLHKRSLSLYRHLPLDYGN
jgi:hypothetical protein